MTLSETEDIAKECHSAARPAPRQLDIARLLSRAAEAIEYLLAELEQAEGVVEYLEQFEP